MLIYVVSIKVNLVFFSVVTNKQQTGIQLSTRM